MSVEKKILDKCIEKYYKTLEEYATQDAVNESTVETSVFMIKANFGDNVRSKDWTAQVNEVLCKIIAHNIRVVIQETHELGISPTFTF